MELKLELKGIDKVLSVLEPSKTRKAVARTLNELGSKASTLLVKEVRQRYSIKAKDLKNFIKVKRSNYGTLQYFMDIKSKSLNVTRFGAKKLKQKGHVSVKIKNTKARSTLVPAFFSNKKGNAVLTRIGKTQEIKGISTLSIPQMFNQKILEKAEGMVGNEYDRLFKKNFDFYIGKKSIAIVLTSWLIFIVKKSNYREYIKNEFNFCKLDKKVLPRLLASRVLSSAKKL